MILLPADHLSIWKSSLRFAANSVYEKIYKMCWFNFLSYTKKVISNYNKKTAEQAIFITTYTVAQSDFFCI